MGLLIDTADTPIKANSSVTGIGIKHSGEALEKVHSKVSTFSLLSTSNNSEVMHLSLKREGRLSLMPSGSITEVFYLLSGELSYEPFGMIKFYPGDSVTTANLSAPVILTAVADTQLLYVTSKPQFHLLSSHLTELRTLAVEVELKDGYTADHCDRLQSLSYATARELGLYAGNLVVLDYSSYLHDVGKVKVPLSILNKPGKLTPEEWQIIKQHPTFGRELIDQTFMKEAGKVVEQHHERYDGSGYPFGLCGDEISVEASIVAVADTFDAMTTDRPYAVARTEYEAILELRRYAGIHYPKEIVEAFCASLKTSTQKLLEV